MKRLEAALIQASSDLTSLEAEWALIGGFAVSARSEPRFTRDIDLAVAVDDDQEAEEFVRSFSALGYQRNELLEQEATDRMAGVRLANGEGVLVDLLFASSGIEREIVRAAERIEVVPGFVVPVARRGHLVALKVLADRDQDRVDLRQLLLRASREDLLEARNALELIDRRGFSRGEDLPSRLARALGNSETS